MDLKEQMASGKLDYYAFIWLLLMLLFSAGAMFLGAKPPILLLVGSSVSAVWSLLNLSWIISGVASVYMLYQWNQNNKEIFGGKDAKDTYSFLFMIVVGINIGITGILGDNIFLNIAYGANALLLIAGVLCLVATGYLFKRWNDNGKKIFSESGANNESTNTDNSKEE